MADQKQIVAWRYFLPVDKRAAILCDKCCTAFQQHGQFASCNLLESNLDWTVTVN